MLGINDAEEYWQKRAEEHGSAAVGFDSSHNTDKQKKEYQERISFIFRYLPTKLTTIDYGCGVGMYAPYFKNYIGLDMTEKMIHTARNRNAGKQFSVLDEPWITKSYSAEQVFTATVLQHCNDELVVKILESFHKIQGLKMLAFYEKDNGDKKSHVVSRTYKDYCILLDIASWKTTFKESHSHIVHNEKHSLHRFEVLS